MNQSTLKFRRTRKLSLSLIALVSIAIAQPLQAGIAARAFVRLSALIAAYMTYPVTHELLHGDKENSNFINAAHGAEKGVELFPEAYKAAMAKDQKILKSLKDFFKSKKAKEVVDKATDTVKKARETLSEITGNSDSKE